jgi:CRP-like cAMP-binding protein
MVGPDAAEQFLASPFLVDLDSAARQAILAVLEEHRQPAGAVLLTQGEPNDRIFFLIEGTVGVERALRGGLVEWVLNLNAPNGFGETSFFQKKPQIVSVRTVTAIRYLTLDRQAYEMLRRADPRTSEQLAQAAIRVLAEHFDLIDQRVAEILSRQPDPGPEETEWNRFRARLFSESML